MRASPQIYEGTNGIQAIDLVTRKLPMDGGAVVRGLSSTNCAKIVAAVKATQRSGVRRDRRAARPTRSTASSARPSGCWRRSASRRTRRLAGATPYLRLFGLTLRAAACWREEALAGMRDEDAQAAERVALARFFAENIAVQAWAVWRRP